MSWTSPDRWPTLLFSGHPVAILIAFAVSVILPVLLHWYFYATSPRAASTPAFLLLGSTGAGKTSLLTLLQGRSSGHEAAESSPTRTSQNSSTVSLVISPSVPLGSNKYRSKNDTSLEEAARNPTRYQMTDTPGHGKLRLEKALSFLEDPALRGIIFVVDATAMDSVDVASARDAASYLHDTLFALQKRKTGKGSSKAMPDLPVLIAANKQDLFTALPAGAVRDRLETEIERVRTSRKKGLVTVGNDSVDDEDDEVLGGSKSEKFSFKLLLDEFGISVDVLGGAVRGEEADKGVRRWEEWIGGCL